MSRHPYQYDDAPVLVNKRGIKNAKLLDEAEAAVTNYRAAQLFQLPIDGTYDLAHMQAIHSTLFGDLYDWAGRVRISSISKTTFDRLYRTTFASPDEIEALALRIAEDLANADYLRNLAQDEFTEKLLDTHVKWNYAHPFPEGNGRATQTMMRQLAWEAGFYLDYTGLNKNEWANANAFALPHVRLYERGAVAIDRQPDRTLLASMFEKIVRPREDVDPAPATGWFIR